jgi:hypothetical protein
MKQSDRIKLKKFIDEDNEILGTVDSYDRTNYRNTEDGETLGLKICAKDEPTGLWIPSLNVIRYAINKGFGMIMAVDGDDPYIEIF